MIFGPPSPQRDFLRKIILSLISTSLPGNNGLLMAVITILHLIFEPYQSKRPSRQLDRRAK